MAYDVAADFGGKYVLLDEANQVGRVIMFDGNGRWQIDFSASQNIAGGLRAYFEIVNMTNEPLLQYMGTPDRPIVREFYSWWMHAGVRWSLN